MSWEWPQWAMAFHLGLTALGAIVMNGTPRTGKINGALILTLAVAEFIVLQRGGFWK